LSRSRFFAIEKPQFGEEGSIFLQNAVGWQEETFSKATWMPDLP
jgi:hypothetical protein